MKKVFNLITVFNSYVLLAVMPRKLSGHPANPPSIPPLARGEKGGWIPAQHTAGMTEYEDCYEVLNIRRGSANFMADSVL